MNENSVEGKKENRMIESLSKEVCPVLVKPGRKKTVDQVSTSSFVYRSGTNFVFLNGRMHSIKRKESAHRAMGRKKGCRLANSSNGKLREGEKRKTRAHLYGDQSEWVEGC